MNILNCTFASSAPSSFLLWALFFYAVGMVAAISWAADRLIRGVPVTTRATLLFVAGYTAAMAGVGLFAAFLAANGYMPVKGCVPNPLAALWATVLGVVAAPATVALRHVYRQRRERAHVHSFGGYATRTGRINSAQPTTSATPSR